MGKQTDTIVHHRIRVWVSIIVIASGISMLAIWLPKAGAPRPSANVVPPRIVSLNDPALLPPGFPKDLLLEPAAPFTVAAVAFGHGSSTLLNATSSKRYLVEWASSRPVESVLGSYKDYFSTHGWTVTVRGQNPAYPGGEILDAKKASSTAVSLSIAPRANGANVIIGFIVK